MVGQNLGIWFSQAESSSRDGAEAAAEFQIIKRSGSWTMSRYMGVQMQ